MKKQNLKAKTRHNLKSNKSSIGITPKLKEKKNRKFPVNRWKERMLTHLGAILTSSVETRTTIIFRLYITGI